MGTSRFSLLALSTLATACFGSLSPLDAAALRVSPILIDGGSQSNATITLRNQEDRPLNAQVRVFRWSQKDGKEQLLPTDDMIASPPIVSIAGKEEYVIRLQRTAGKEPVAEEAYRVVVDELPNPDRQRNGTVAVVLRYIVPAFFFPADASQPRVHWSVEHRDGRAFIVAENSGDKRVQLTNLGVKSGGHTMMVGKGLAGYVLGHSTNAWPLSGKLASLRSGTIVAMSDRGALSAPLQP